MWLNNMVTDGFGKLENNSCMFKQLIVPITHYRMGHQLFLFSFLCQKCWIQQPPQFNVGTPRFLSILTDLDERNMSSYSKRSQHTKLLSAVCKRKAVSLTTVHTHGILVNVNFTGSYVYRFLNDGTAPWRLRRGSYERQAFFHTLYNRNGGFQ